MTTSSEARRLAWRWGLGAVAATAVVVYTGAALLDHDLAQTTVSFAMFAALFGGTAAFLGAEVAASRRCPRCGEQQTSRPEDCAACGYDVRARPTFVCPEGHRALEPGLCACGRRLQLWVPPDIGRQVRRSLYLGAALLAAMVVTGLLLGR